VIKATEAIKTAEGLIALARSGYYPTISGEADYTIIGPVPKLTIPNMGSFELAPRTTTTGRSVFLKRFMTSNVRQGISNSRNPLKAFGKKCGIGKAEADTPYFGEFLLSCISSTAIIIKEKQIAT